jgi:hypothetical protein
MATNENYYNEGEGEEESTTLIEELSASFDDLNVTSVTLPPSQNSSIINATTTDTLVGTFTSSSTASPHSPPDTSDALADVMAVGWVVLLLWCCCRRRTTPGPEHWRGAEIRRRYQEMMARERAKEERDNQTPEYRRRMVKHSMRTKVNTKPQSNEYKSKQY